MAEKTYVYGLLCPIENKVRYVGQSIQPALRFKAHLNSGNGVPSNAREEWIKSLKEQNLKPELVILEAVKRTAIVRYSRDAAASEAECRWIGRLLNEGHPLTNNGGELKKSEADTRNAHVFEEAVERGRQMFG